tara:strand:+ start:505 stop:1665 length:1161 start_codon:yes stop_codon:yes gene_type:complete
MAKVIDELLIGVSVDADEREFNEVQSGFDQIKSSALSLGAVLAGGLSIDAILGKTSELAAEWDGLAKETAAFEVDPILLQNLQHMSESLGGAKEDAMSLLMNLRSTQQGLQVGNLGYLEELTKITGQDVIPLFQSGDEEDILKRLINLFGDMNTQQRQAAFDVMGLTTGTRNLMQTSVEGYEAMIARSNELGNITKENTTRAENFEQAWTDAAKASDAAWQNFYGSLMEGSTESLNYVTGKLIESRKAQEGSEGFLQTYQAAAGEVVQSTFSDIYESILDKIAPDGWQNNPMLSRDALIESTPYERESSSGVSDEYRDKFMARSAEMLNQGATNNTTNRSSNSVQNYNNITIQAGGMTQGQVEGVVYKVINGAANQTEQDLQVNSQ